MTPQEAHPPPGRPHAPRLRFPAPLESEFRAWYLEAVSGQRLVLLAATLVMVGATPLLDQWFLQPPEAFIATSRWLQFAMAAPLLIAALAVTASPRARPWSDVATILAFLGVSALVLVQRRLAAELGFYFPSTFASAALAAGFLVSGLRLRQMVPAGLAMFAAFCANEWAVAEGPIGFTYQIQANTILLCLAAGGCLLHELHVRRRWQSGRALQSMATIDSLTGLPNRRHFGDEFAQLFATARAEGRELAVALVDIDHFKQLNDEFGHAVGDHFLAAAGRAMARHAAQHDAFAARYGGEEFILVYRRASALQARRLLETLRRDLAQLRGPATALRAHGITASLGAAVLTPQGADTPARVIAAADRALYAAKLAGRDCVRVHEPAPSQRGALPEPLKAEAADPVPPDVLARHDAELAELRFDPALERAFEEADSAAGAGQRRLTLAATAIVAALTPFIDSTLLERPAAVVATEFWTQLGVMVPLLIVALWIGRRPAPRASRLAVTAASVGIALGLVYQRHVSATFGIEVPLAYIPTVLIGALLVCRLQLRRYVPYALGVMVVTIVEEALAGRALSVFAYDMFALVALTAIGMVGSYLLERDARKTWLYHRELHWRSNHDALTGLQSRRAFLESLEQLAAEARRVRRPLALALIDVDHFKAFNDHYGHVAGDECLRQVAAVLQQALAPSALRCARVGGEEFAVAWIARGGSDCQARLESLRQAVAGATLPHDAAPSGVVTISAGGAVVGGATTPADVLRLADAELYQAKAAGRNCVRVRVVPAPEPSAPRVRPAPVEA